VGCGAADAARGAGDDDDEGVVVLGHDYPVAGLEEGLGAPDLVRPAKGPVQLALALAGVGELMAMSTEEVAARAVELGDAAPAGDAVHHPRTDEVRPGAAQPTGHADDADGLVHLLPLAAGDTDAVQETEQTILRPHTNPGDLLAVLGPPPSTLPAGAQTARPVQPVDVE
jgi:hypothetical protein